MRQQLQLGPDAIELVSVEPVEWPDQCLGISLPDRLCAPAITPGYRIIVQAGGQEYEYRTDQAGNRIELAAAPEPDLAEVTIRWRQVEEVCTQAEIGVQQVAFGQCGGAMMTVPLVQEMNRPQELAGFVQTYASFQADTPAGEITFTGQGATSPAPSEQRMIAEWAHQVALEAQAGRSGASWGLALAVHEEGDEPPLCRDITVYVTGVAYATSCLNGQATTVGSLQLDAGQLEQVYSWVDTLRSFDVVLGEDPIHDLIFSGSGAGKASAADQQAMLALAGEIYAQLDGGLEPGAMDRPASTGDTITVLEWEGYTDMGDGDATRCKQLQLTLDNQALIGDCATLAEPAPLPATHAQEWAFMQASFAPFTLTTATDRLEFRGAGNRAGEAWQRALLAWTHLAYGELASGRASAAVATALSWNLGEAPTQPGLCNHLSVTVYGYAYADHVPCTGGPVQNRDGAWLPDQEMAQFDRWLYNRQPLYEGDNYLAGLGDEPMSQAERAELAAWVEEVYLLLRAAKPGLGESVLPEDCVAPFEQTRTMSATALSGSSANTSRRLRANQWCSTGIRRRGMPL